MNNQCNNNNTINTYHKNYCNILNNMINAMTCAALGNSISADFIVQMIPHHKAAIEMSENILQYSDNCRIRAIAKNIIKEQTQSIADMEEILCRCKKCTNSPCDRSKYEAAMREIMDAMFCEMRNAETTNCVNCDFMREMIPHHEGAVKMSETTLKYCICEELVPIMNAIIKSQKKGIAEMKKLLQCLNCE